MIRGRNGTGPVAGGEGAMKRLTERYLKIYEHEFTRFSWITSIFFVLFFVTAIFRNYVDAAFLKRYGPDYIPWMLVINALLTFVVLGGVDRLAKRYKDHFLLSGCLAFYALSCAVLFLMVKEGFTIVYPILYQLLYLLDSILLVYLWNIAGDLFDTRQGKRIFPLVTAGQVLGTTLGSFATRPLTKITGEDAALLIFAAICLGTCFFMATTASGILGPSRQKGGPGRTAQTTKKLSEVPGLMKKYPIVRYLVITGLVPNILLPIFFYQFSEIANATFKTEGELISFLSVFRGCTTSVSFILLFFMGRVYSTIGLTNSALVQPANFAALFGGLSVFFNIYLASYGQFSVILIQRAIAGPINKVFFDIVPQELITWSRTFVRGTVLKVGMLTGSLLMIVLKPVMQARYLSIFALGFAVYWLFETLRFRRHYKRGLKQVIVEKEIDFDRIESIRAFDSGGAARELDPLSVEHRMEDTGIAWDLKPPQMEPDQAMRLLQDSDPRTRADAAASFGLSKDVRAVGLLMRCLDEPDDKVRSAAIEALIAYPNSILPFLEVSLVDSSPRVQQGILEVMRLSGMKDFEYVPFIGKELSLAYGNLIVIRGLESLNGNVSVGMLRDYLRELNDELLRLIFYALWVYHADMRLMYHALKSETASIAIEMVENSIQREVVPYLIPLIEDIPVSEKIDKGRKLLPLVRSNNLNRLVTYLVESKDPVTRMLSLYLIADQMPDVAFVPIVEARMNDESSYVRDTAAYAMAKIRLEEPQMPDIIDRISKLKMFGLFEDMGIRELHAIATVVNEEHFESGGVMIVEGEENSSIYLVVEGSVDIYSGYGTEVEKKKATIGPGSFLGELSMFTRLPPNATCLAAAPTDAFVLPHHQFQEIMRVYPQIGINLCRFFSLKCRLAVY
ncbi:MAG: HEAT repeat domain-containing protein [Pseudomonadota bacterium]